MMTKTKFKPIAVLACMILVVLALFCIGNTEVSAETYSGYCGGEGDGTNLTWSLDTETGVLEISGSGAMADYSFSNPWYSYSSYVKTAKIGDSVTSIGSSAFYGCISLTSVTIPDSVTSIGVGAFSNTGYYNNGENWENGVLYIDKYLIKADRSISGSYAIKEGTKVITDYAFSNCSSLTSVTIPDSVTSIGRWAFADCTGLTSVSIGKNVTSISNSAFSDCTGLTEIKFNATECADLPSGGNYVFSKAGNDANGITVTFGDNVKRIPAHLLAPYSGTGEYAPNIKTVNIGNSVESIGDYAFFYCTGLTRIEIPNSVTSIGKCVFWHCEGLKNLIIPDSITSIGRYAFSDCTELTTVEIGNSVTSIGDFAFQDCNKLTSVTFKSVDGWLLYKSSSSMTNGTNLSSDSLADPSTAAKYLTDTYCTKYWFRTTTIIAQGTCGANGDNLTWTLTDSGVLSITGSGAMANYSHSYNSTTGNYETLAPWRNYIASITSIKIGDGITNIGNCAFRYCTGITSVEIGNSVTNIHFDAFYSCTSLTSVKLGDSVEIIGSYAFAYCSSLTSIEFPNSVTLIGSHAFMESSIKNVELGDSVKFIGSNAFSGCTSLTSIVIPNSVTIIYENAFWDCTNLTSVYITDIEAWCKISFENQRAQPLFYAKLLYVNGELADEIIIPEGITTISDYMLSCENITKVTISDSVTKIGDYAFQSCISLKSVELGGNVKFIGNGAFEKCTSLMSIVIPDSVTSIDAYAFFGCTNLTSVFISNNVESIVSHTFSDCTSLMSVEIPVSVTSIGAWAFYNCSSLVSVEIPNSVITIGTWAFSDCTSLTSIVIPNSVTSIGNWVFLRCTSLTSVTFNATDGWWYSSSSTATGGTPISSSDLANSSTAAKYLTSTYEAYHWFRTATHTHSYTAVITPPTCTEGGYTTYTCSCGDSYIADEVAALGHNYLTLVTAPTCTEKGFTTYICLVCNGGYNGDYTAMLPHEYGDDGYCTACGNEEVIADGLFVWQLTKSGVLKIDGKGAMPDYNSNTMPWAAYRGMIARIEIGEGITSVGRCAFYGCSALRSVSLPSTVTEIKEYGFYGCGNLTEITIPASVTAIGKYAFRRAGLVSVDFGVNYGWSAGESAFTATEVYGLGAGYLTKNYYKFDWVRDINAEAEEVDPNFVTGGACNTTVKWELVYIDEAKTQMKLTVSGNGAMPDYGTGSAPWYAYLDQIVEIEVESGVTAIGRCAFYGLKNVTSVTLHEGLVSIGDYAFNTCRSLAVLIIPDSVTAIGKDAFGKTQVVI